MGEVGNSTGEVWPCSEEFVALHLRKQEEGEYSNR